MIFFFPCNFICINYFRVITWSSNFTCRHICKRIENICSEKNCKWMFIPALFVIAKRWKTTQCLWTYEWLNKMWYIHPLLGHKKEWSVSINATVDEPWKYSSQTERSQTWETAYCMISCTWNINNRQIYRDQR